MNIQFQPTYPVSSLLKKYVYCYYTLKSTSTDFKSEHYSFPHIYNAVSIYNGATITSPDGNLMVKGNGSNTPICVLQGKRQYPLLVNLQGPLSRITIIFKPLGINHFIDRHLADIMGTQPSVFDEWSVPDNLFISDAPNLAILEEYLISIYRPFHQPELKHALQLLADFEEERTIDDIAAIIGLPVRSFNRLFKKHLGVSPITHRRIAQFRHSLENKFFHDRFKNLTEIGYESNFYDQSYFIKLYKQLAGSNPGLLFRKLEQIGDSKVLVEFKE